MSYSPTDSELLARYARGDDASIEAFVARWNERLVHLATRLLGDPEEARDVRQQAFAILLREFERVDGAIGTWLYRVAVNQCRDRLRRRREEELDDLEPEAAPDDPVERADLASRVAAAIAALPDLEREALVLRHYEDLPFPQIAAITGTPATTLKSRVSRALDRLEAELAELRHV